MTSTVDFKVKVYRYTERRSRNGEYIPESWDGWFVSKVYAIKDDQNNGVMFLVYDDGELSSDENYYGGFYWVSAEATMCEPGDYSIRKPLVELVDE